MDNLEMLKKFSGFIEDELEDIEKYAKQAIKWKDVRSDIAEGFANLSKQEASHYQSLHDMVVKLIKYAADDGTGMTAEEQSIYEFLRDREMDKYSKAKEWQDMYKRCDDSDVNISVTRLSKIWHQNRDKFGRILSSNLCHACHV